VQIGQATRERPRQTSGSTAEELLIYKIVRRIFERQRRQPIGNCMREHRTPVAALLH
jgi:hypothetical protein